MPIREMQLKPLHPVSDALPAGRAARAVAIRHTSTPAGRSAGAIRQKLASGLDGVLSIFSVVARTNRNEQTGSDALAARLVRIEALLGHAISGAKSSAESETLLMGQSLVNEMGRRLQLLQSGGHIAIDAE